MEPARDDDEGSPDAPGAQGLHHLAAGTHPLISSMGVGVMVYDAAGRIVDANRTALELLALGIGEVTAVDPVLTRPTELDPHPVRPDGSMVKLDELPVVKALRTRRPQPDEVVGLRRRDGTLRWLLVSAWPLVEHGELHGAVVTVTDHTDRREVERTNRTVRRAMHVLVHATDVPSLLRDMCQTIVEAGEFALAWIGKAETDGTGRVTALAASGARDYVTDDLVSWAPDDPLGSGPTGRCLRERTVRVVNDYHHAAEVGPWRERAAEYGLGSGIAIPFDLPDGSRAALSIYARDIEAFDEQAIGLLEGLARDLQYGLRHIATTEALAASEERFRLLAENTGDVVMLTRHGLIEWISPSARAVLGWAPDEAVGQRFVDRCHPDDLGVVERARAESRQGIHATYRGRVLRHDGTWLWVDARTRPIADADGRPDGSIVTTIWDTTAEVTAQHALEHAASHDSLTGLANRSLLLDELDRALAASRRSGTSTAVLLLDLDHFKYVNDSLGHAVGDDLLRAAAARMSAAVRDGDLVARQGGDEFVVVMRDLDHPAEAAIVAERLMEAFRSPITVGDAELFTTASIGVAVASSPGQDAIDLLREADTAMYRAKEDGRDRLAMFNEDLRDTVTRRLRIANELRAAVERDELAVWFQPEIHLDDGHLRAVEALLRWHHPSGELRSAAHFIETAEETGMILDIGRWVIQQSCRHAARWLSTRPDSPLVVRVNLSSLQLAEAGLLGDLDDALRSAGLAPDRLCVEITETAMLHETTTVRANMAGIAERGIRTAIDDFGTGYASLTYLRRYPVDVVKLDRSFVTNLTTQPQDRHIAAGIIDMAARLGISVTAEGVERPEQAELLRDLGCTGAQGYLYSPAVPSDEIEVMLDKGPLGP